MSVARSTRAQTRAQRHAEREEAREEIASKRRLSLEAFRDPLQPESERKSGRLYERKLEALIEQTESTMAEAAQLLAYHEKPRQEIDEADRAYACGGEMRRAHVTAAEELIEVLHRSDPQALVERSQEFERAEVEPAYLAVQSGTLDPEEAIARQNALTVALAKARFFHWEIKRAERRMTGVSVPGWAPLNEKRARGQTEQLAAKLSPVDAEEQGRAVQSLDEVARWFAYESMAIERATADHAKELRRVFAIRRKAAERALRGK